MSEAKLPGFLFAKVDIILAHVFGKCLFVFAQLRSDVFETGQCFDAAQTVMFCNRFLQIGSDKCFDDHGARCVFLVEDALIKQRLATIVGKERADLITGQQLHFVAFRAYRCTHPVAIRIGRYNEIGIFLFREVDCHRQRLGVLRVWRLQCRESAVETVLLWYDFEIEPQPFKHRLDNHSPGSVKRRVNDTERFCLANNLRIENQRLEPLHVRFIDFFSERRDFPLSIFR